MPTTLSVKPRGWHKPWLGKSRSEETKQKLRDHNLGKTMSQGMRDKTSARVTGSGNPAAVLNETDVLFIRNELIPQGLSDTAIARTYGVNPITIHRVRRRVTWNHI